MLAVIARDVDYSIVRAGPDRSFFYRGLRERKDRVVIFNRRNVVCKRAAAWLLFAFIVARQIAADLGPALAVIGRFENALRRRVEHVRVVWRQHKRRNPLETMGHIDGPVSGIIERDGTDVLHLFFAFIVTNPSVTLIV